MSQSDTKPAYLDAREHQKVIQKELSELVPLDGPIKTHSLEAQLDKLHNKKNSIDMKILR